MRNIDNIILIGDFNFSNIQWERDKKNEPSCIPSKISSVCNKFDIFSECIDECGLMQFNVYPTCYGKVLDLFYSSINNICVSVTISAVVSDHLALVAEIPVSVKQIKLPE